MRTLGRSQRAWRDACELSGAPDPRDVMQPSRQAVVDDRAFTFGKLFVSNICLCYSYLFMTKLFVYGTVICYFKFIHLGNVFMKKLYDY
jgi:hypothetical protein